MCSPFFLDIFQKKTYYLETGSATWGNEPVRASGIFLKLFLFKLMKTSDCKFFKSSGTSSILLSAKFNHCRLLRLPNCGGTVMMELLLRPSFCNLLSLPIDDGMEMSPQFMAQSSRSSVSSPKASGRTDRGLWFTPRYVRCFRELMLLGSTVSWFWSKMSSSSWSRSRIWKGLQEGSQNTN